MGFFYFGIVIRLSCIGGIEHRSTMEHAMADGTLFSETEAVLSLARQIRDERLTHTQKQQILTLMQCNAPEIRVASQSISPAQAAEKLRRDPEGVRAQMRQRAEAYAQQGKVLALGGVDKLWDICTRLAYAETMTGQRIPDDQLVEAARVIIGAMPKETHIPSRG